MRSGGRVTRLRNAVDCKSRTQFAKLKFRRLGMEGVVHTARTLRRSIEVVAADVIMPCSGSYSDGYCGFRAHLVSTPSENVKIKAGQASHW